MSTNKKLRFNFNNPDEAKKAKSAVEGKFPSVLITITKNAIMVINSTHSFNLDNSIEEFVSSVGGEIM